MKYLSLVLHPILERPLRSSQGVTPQDGKAGMHLILGKSQRQLSAVFQTAFHGSETRGVHSKPTVTKTEIALPVDV